jgi:hypothetical protein
MTIMMMGDAIKRGSPVWFRKPMMEMLRNTDVDNLSRIIKFG